MPFQIIAGIMLITALQTSPADRVRAEELAREGRTTEALALFERIVGVHPLRRRRHAARRPLK